MGPHFLVLVFLFATSALLARPSEPVQREETVEYLVVWRDTVNLEKQRQSLNSLNTRHGLKRTRRANSRGRRNIESFVFRHQHNRDSVINAYMKTGLFEIVEVAPSFSPHTISISVTPNDPFFPDQWYLKSGAMNMDSTWFITEGCSSVVIAIIDAGFTIDHPEISSRLWVNPNANNITSGFIGDVHGWNFVENNHNLNANPASSWKSANHGTLVSSSMGVTGNNQTGFAGATWKNPLMLLRIWDDAGNTSASAFIDAIEYAVRNGARIINMSFGSTTNSRIIEGVINDAHRAGVIMFASMGNFGDSTVYYPAGYDNVFAVGAYDQSGKRATFSSFGNHLDFLAPGTSIYSIYNRDYSQYIKVSGTSFSSAMASASAGLILSVNPNLTRNELIEIFKIGSMDLRGSPQEDTEGFDRFHGWGNLNTYRAVRNVKERYNTHPQITNTSTHFHIGTQDGHTINIATTDFNRDSVFVELASVSNIFVLNGSTLSRVNFDLFGHHFVNVIAHDVWDTTRVSFSFLINSPPFFSSPLVTTAEGTVFDTITTVFSIADSNDALPRVTFSGNSPVAHLFSNDTVFAKWVFRDTGQFVSQVSLIDSTGEASRDTLTINFSVGQERLTYVLSTMEKVVTNNNLVKIYPNPFYAKGNMLIQSKKSGYFTVNFYTLDGSKLNSINLHLVTGENRIPISFELNKSQVVLVRVVNNSNIKIADTHFYYIAD